VYQAASWDDTGEWELARAQWVDLDLPVNLVGCHDHNRETCARHNHLRKDTDGGDRLEKLRGKKDVRHRKLTGNDLGTCSVHPGSSLPSEFV
jgi:hypothetical protein